MRKRFVLGALFCLFAAAVSASAQGNFAGDWTLDKDQSELGERSRLKSMTMNVTQSDNELTYERKIEQEEGGQGGGRGMGGGRGGDPGAVTFDLEGKETTAKTPRGEAKLKAKKVDGNKLELTRSQTFEGRMGTMTITTIETWELSEDGKTLTISSETETPRGARSSKMIFIKN